MTYPMQTKTSCWARKSGSGRRKPSELREIPSGSKTRSETHQCKLFVKILRTCKTVRRLQVFVFLDFFLCCFLDKNIFLKHFFWYPTSVGCRPNAIQRRRPAENVEEFPSTSSPRWLRWRIFLGFLRVVLQQEKSTLIGTSRRYYMLLIVALWVFVGIYNIRLILCYRCVWVCST